MCRIARNAIVEYRCPISSRIHIAVCLEGRLAPSASSSARLGVHGTDMGKLGKDSCLVREFVVVWWLGTRMSQNVVFLVAATGKFDICKHSLFSFNSNNTPKIFQITLDSLKYLFALICFVHVK